MCGIAGFIGNGKISDQHIDVCQKLMRRRGPDQEGYVKIKTSNGNMVHLLHSRLSIIDLDPRSKQPFSHHNNVITYNGEIYNYLELKSQLEAQGEIFSTSGDTEVLAKQLSCRGVESINHCEGMWSFAWYDSNKDRLYLSRDRFGEKPLYYYESSAGLYFGSEPKFIFALLGYSLPINKEQLKRYLVNGYKSLYKGQETFFDGLYEVLPGTFMEYDGESITAKRRYWKPSFEIDESMTYEQAVAGTREKLIRSVELRLRSDVPIAFCLSGGIDSNALISIAKRELNYDVHGFTVMNTDSRYEERDMVELAVKELKLRHTAISVSTDNFLNNLREQIKYHDAPIYTITYYAQWCLMESIKSEGYKVSVSGTAADELFSGYYDHHNAYLAAMKNENTTQYEQALNAWRDVVLPIVRNPFLQDPDYFIKYPDSRDHIYLDADVFSSYLHDEYSEIFTEESYTSSSLLRNRMANELFHESVPVILHEDDLNAMYYSVENRSPFLDSDLFSWSQKIPTRHLVKNGRAKSVLRDAAIGLAPEKIMNNPRKIGFNAPLESYLDIGSENIKDSLLEDSPIFDVVKRDKIESMLSMKELPNSRSKFLFNFICSKIFLEEYAA